MIRRGSNKCGSESERRVVVPSFYICTCWTRIAFSSRSRSASTSLSRGVSEIRMLKTTLNEESTSGLGPSPSISWLF